MNDQGWGAYEKLVLYMLKQNTKAIERMEADMAAVREQLLALRSDEQERIVKLQTREKVKGGAISAIVSALVVLLQKLF